MWLTGGVGAEGEKAGADAESEDVDLSDMVTVYQCMYMWLAHREWCKAQSGVEQCVY